MSSSSKKRGGIGDFWDNLAPPPEEVAPPKPEPQPESAPPPASRTNALAEVTDDPAPVASRPGATARTTPQPRAQTPATRGRGRPPSNQPKERMTVNLAPRSLQILESLRYQARMKGQRSATFSDLLDEAVALLAKHYKLRIEEESA